MKNPILILKNLLLGYINRKVQEQRNAMYDLKFVPFQPNKITAKYARRQQLKIYYSQPERIEKIRARTISKAIDITNTKDVKNISYCCYCDDKGLHYELRRFPRNK